MRVTSNDTGLRNANINTIYQITIVSHRDKKGVVVVLGGGRVVLERSEGKDRGSRAAEGRRGRCVAHDLSAGAHSGVC